MSTPKVRDASSVSFFELAEDLKAPKPLRRVFSLARHHNVKAIIELTLGNLDPTSEREEELFRSANSRLDRKRVMLALSTADPEDVESALPAVPKCVGYCILHYDTCTFSNGKTEDRVYVSEAVVKPPKNVSGSRYLHCQRTFSADVGELKLSVAGAYFAQQPRITGCCAHASLLMGLRTMGKGHHLDYSSINQRLDLPIPERQRADECGLNAVQVKEILESQNVEVRNFAFRFDPRSGETYEPEDVSAADKRLARHRPIWEAFTVKRIVYHAVESGFPVLLSWETEGNQRDNHVFVVLGHVFDKHRWFAEAVQEYSALRPKQRPDQTAQVVTDLQLTSCAWTRDFLISDDNFGPYYSMSTGDLSKHRGLVRALVLTPEGVPFLAPSAELEAMKMSDALCSSATWEPKLPVQPENVWFQRLEAAAQRGLLILRTVYADRKRYLRQLQSSRNFQGIDTLAVGRLEDALPETFWMVEFSLPELYPVNKARLAEVFFVQDPGGQNSFSVEPIGFRLPGYFATTDGLKVEAVRTTMDSYYDLYEIAK